MSINRNDYTNVFFNKEFLSKHIDEKMLQTIPDPDTPMTLEERLNHLQKIMVLTAMEPKESDTLEDCNRCDFFEEGRKLYNFLDDRVYEEKYYKKFKRFPKSSGLNSDDESDEELSDDSECDIDEDDYMKMKEKRDEDIPVTTDDDETENDSDSNNSDDSDRMLTEDESPHYDADFEDEELYYYRED